MRSLIIIFTLFFSCCYASDTYAELKEVRQSDLMQGGGHGACILYSFLHGALQNERIAQSLGATFTKDSSGNYLAQGQFLATPEFVSQLGGSLFPSPKPIIKAIGHFSLTYLKERLGDIPDENYVLYFNGRDMFFNRPIFEIPDVVAPGGQQNQNPFLSRLQFMPDGTLKDTLYNQLFAGDFVLSIASGGHAISAYFDKNTNSWQMFDNMSGVQPIESLRNYLIHNCIVIGFY